MVPVTQCSAVDRISARIIPPPCIVACAQCTNMWRCLQTQRLCGAVARRCQHYAHTAAPSSSGTFALMVHGVTHAARLLSADVLCVRYAMPAPTARHPCPTAMCCGNTRLDASLFNVSATAVTVSISDESSQRWYVQSCACLRNA